MEHFSLALLGYQIFVMGYQIFVLGHDGIPNVR